MGSIGNAIGGAVSGFVGSGGNPWGAAVGAAGGLLGGEGEESGTSTSTSTSLPAWLDEASKEAAAKAATSLYGKNNTAPLTAGQNKAIETALSSSGNYAPYTTSAKTMMDTYSPAITGDMISAYQNPYTEEVLKGNLAKLEESYNKALKNQGLKAATLGAYGGSQFGVQNALQTKDYLTNVSDTTNKTLADAYESAYKKASDEQERKLSGATEYSKLATDLSNLTGADISRLMATGTIARDYNSELLNEDYTDAQKMAALLAQSKYGTSTTTNQTNSSGGGLSGAIGGGMSAMDLLGGSIGSSFGGGQSDASWFNNQLSGIRS